MYVAGPNGYQPKSWIEYEFMLEKGYFEENPRLDFGYENKFDESDVFMIRTIISKYF